MVGSVNLRKWPLTNLQHSDVKPQQKSVWSKHNIDDAMVTITVLNLEIYNRSGSSRDKIKENSQIS